MSPESKQEKTVSLIEKKRVFNLFRGLRVSQFFFVLSHKLSFEIKK